MLIYVLQNNSSHSTLWVNRVKCEKILHSVGFKSTTSCIRGKLLSARPQGPHGRKRTTPRLILKYFESRILPRAKIWFLHIRCITLFRVEYEDMFCKTYIKLLKLIKI